MFIAFGSLLAMLAAAASGHRRGAGAAADYASHAMSVCVNLRPTLAR